MNLVSENLVSKKKYRLRFQKKLDSEKSLGFGEFGFGKKSLGFDFGKLGLGKFGLGKKVSVSENLVSEKRKSK